MEKRKWRIVVVLSLAIAVAAVATVVIRENALAKSNAAAARFARCDFSDAAAEMAETAEMLLNDEDAVYRFVLSAGEARAHLSRARLDGCERVYALIGSLVERVRAGEDVISLCRAFSDAASRVEADGGKALCELLETKQVQEVLLREQGANGDFLCLKGLGDGGKAQAERTASRFCCENCKLRLCDSYGFPPSYVFTGKNVYISLTYDGERVLEYCFDRDVDLSRDVGRERALEVALGVLNGQKLSVPNENVTISSADGIYRFYWKDEPAGQELVVLEIYADTGRLRRFSALEYYRNR